MNEGPKEVTLEVLANIIAERKPLGLFYSQEGDKFIVRINRVPCGDQSVVAQCPPTNSTPQRTCTTPVGCPATKECHAEKSRCSTRNRYLAKQIRFPPRSSRP